MTEWNKLVTSSATKKLESNSEFSVELIYINSKVSSCYIKRNGTALIVFYTLKEIKELGQILLDASTLFEPPKVEKSKEPIIEPLGRMVDLK